MKYANIDIYNTPYYMVEGCYGEGQKILSLSTLPDAGGVNLFFPFNEEDSLKSNDKVYILIDNEVKLDSTIRNIKEKFLNNKQGLN